MVANRVAVRRYGEQNPAYEPAHPYQACLGLDRTSLQWKPPPSAIIGGKPGTAVCSTTVAPLRWSLARTEGAAAQNGPRARRARPPKPPLDGPSPALFRYPRHCRHMPYKARSVQNWPNETEAGAGRSCQAVVDPAFEPAHPHVSQSHVAFAGGHEDASVSSSTAQLSDARSPTGSASAGSPPHGVQQSTVGTEDELSDDEALTQFVFARNPPQDRPRPGDLDGLSLLRGALTANEAAGYVRRHVNSAYDDDTVRYTYVGQLRAAGFEVVAAPSKRIAIQVSVSRGAGWSDQACSDFNACFIGDVDAQEGRRRSERRSTG